MNEEVVMTADEVKTAIINSLLEAASHLPDGAVTIEAEQEPREPYGRVRVEISPRNPESAYFEVAADDVDITVFVGENGCTNEIPIVEAISDRQVPANIVGLYRAVADGDYEETLWRHKGHVIRVRGRALVDGQEVIFEQGSRRLARGCSEEVVKYRPYA